MTVDGAGLETEASGTMVNALLANTATNAPGGLINPFAAPRLAADWISPLGITLGAGLGLLIASGDGVNRSSDGEVAEPIPTGRGLLFSPRVGWFLAVTRWLTLWPRAGVTYMNANDTLASGTTRFEFVTFSLDPGVAITPFRHFALVIGPSLDIPLTGSGFTDQSSSRQTLTTGFSSYGGSVGAAVIF